MFLTKKAIPRRTFLKSAQAALALPLLDAMIPAATAWAKTPAKPVARLGFVFVPESRDPSGARLDLPGAVLVTGGLVSAVYAITQAGQNGWVSGRTLGFFAASLVMLAGFGAWERRHPEPLMRFGLLRTRTVSGANVAGFIMGTAMFSMFLMLTLYMQQVLGYSAMKTGLAYLAVAGTASRPPRRRNWSLGSA